MLFNPLLLLVSECYRDSLFLLQLDDPTTKAAKKNGGNTYFSAKKSSSSASLNLPQYASCTDLEMSDEDNNDANAASATASADSGNSSGRVPAPRQLTLEALQNKSLVVGWNPPPHFPSSKVRKGERFDHFC